MKLIASLAIFAGLAFAQTWGSSTATWSAPAAPVVKRDPDGRIHRSQAARTAFVKLHACPSTGKHALPCPGYIIDHVKPLCAGGADKPANMQWQTVADAKKKDAHERKECRK